MDKRELDQFIAEYGESNETEIEGNMELAMSVTKIRKDRERKQQNDTI